MSKVVASMEWRGEAAKVAGKRVVQKSAYDIGLIVEGQAKLLSAVNYGYLAASITTQASDHGTNPSAPVPSTFPRGKNPGAPAKMRIASPIDADEVLVGTPVEYGPYIEYGTVRSNAQPFLRPALDFVQGKTLTVVEKHARDEFKEFAE